MDPKGLFCLALYKVLLSQFDFCVKDFEFVCSVVVLRLVLLLFVIDNKVQGKADVQIIDESIDNRAIVDNNKAQNLTGDDIDAMRRCEFLCCVNMCSFMSIRVFWYEKIFVIRFDAERVRKVMRSLKLSSPIVRLLRRKLCSPK